MSARKHRWTDEDAAFVAAQWASGITLREIGAYFGYRFGGAISVRIRAFLEKYGSLPPVEYDDRGYHAYVYIVGDDRKAMVKQALAMFVAQRNLGYAEREHEELMREGREMGFVGPKARSTHEDAPEAS